MSRTISLALVTLLGWTSAVQAVDPAHVDRIVERARAQWSQPGIAVAVIDGDGPAYLKGYGVRDLRTGAPVTPDTLFGIASCSKSFAAASVARLVDEKKIGWDDRVDGLLPSFRTGDPWVTHELRVRDLLAHHTGLKAAAPRVAAEDRASYLATIAAGRPMHPFRYQYSYTNDMFTAAGELVSAVSGQGWEAFARRELWAPLGMARTNADHRTAKADPDHATPHVQMAGVDQPRPIDWVYEDWSALPSGGVNSSVSDLSRWIRFQMGEGETPGPLSEAALNEMHAPHTPLRGEFAYGHLAISRVVGHGPQAHQFESYGLGWFVQSYRGRRLIYHPGSISGFRCMMGMMPDDDFGFALLFNGDVSPLSQGLMQDLIDLKLGLPDRNWSQAFWTLEQKRRAERKEKADKLLAARVRRTKPSLPLGAYAGAWTGEGGRVDLRLEDGKLMATLGRNTYEAVHWHWDVFQLAPRAMRSSEGVVPWPHPQDDPVFASFGVDEMGEVDSLRIGAMTFRRKP